MFYDMLGQEVARLVKTELSPGIYRMEFNGSLLPSAIYMKRLTAGSYILSR